MACCSWPMVHPERHLIGKPVEVWCKELYEPLSINTIIPVSAITNQVIISVDYVSEEQVLIVIPL